MEVVCSCCWPSKHAMRSWRHGPWRVLVRGWVAFGRLGGWVMDRMAAALW